MTVNTPPTLALVLPCYNEEASINHTVNELSILISTMMEQKEISENSYLFFVDDGSIDATWEIISSLNLHNKLIKGMKLSRNFGHQCALLAGLSEVVQVCDIAISIDADLQQDPQAIPKFVREFNAGADIVLGVRVDRNADGWLKRKTAVFFYAFMRGMGLTIVPNHADYRLLSKKAIQALLTFSEPNIFLRGVCLLLGFKCKTVEFEVHDRRFGSTKYTLRKMVRLAVHGITSLSTIPLRMVAVIGFLICTVSLLMGTYVLWQTLVIGNTIPGWASTILPVYFIGGVQLLCLGVIAEYIGQIFATVKNRPRWITETTLS